jgi:hypothetical protein
MKLDICAKGQIDYKSLWDGFWIEDFVGGNLYLSCSFDRLLYKNYDFIFEDVSFYNIPHEWHDTIYGYSPFREASFAEFLHDFEDEIVEDKMVYALELYFRNYPDSTYTQHCFYVVCKRAYALKCLEGNATSNRTLKDPVENYLSKENRVKYLRKTKQAIEKLENFCLI